MKKNLKNVLILSIVSSIFYGCSNKKTLAEQKTLCENNGGIFKIEKKLNYRTGEVELNGKCY